MCTWLSVASTDVRRLYTAVVGRYNDAFCGIFFFFSSRRRHTRLQGDWNSDVCSSDLFVKDNVVEEVIKLKKEPGKPLFVFGSADLSSTLLKHGLFDELDLALTPLLLGRGNPLFKPNSERIKMKLLEARPLKSGGVILRYQPERTADNSGSTRAAKA